MYLIHVKMVMLLDGVSSGTIRHNEIEKIDIFDYIMALWEYY